MAIHPILALCLVLLPMCASAFCENEEATRKLLGPPRVWLLTADPGAMSGSAENKFYLQNLNNSKLITEFEGFCEGSAHKGMIMGTKVLIITTGIGPLAAASCLASLLPCASNMKEIIYSGTAGWPAAVGGILNPPSASNPHGSCAKANPNAVNRITRLGDVCVSVTAANWDCRLNEWAMQSGGYPNLCFSPIDYVGIDAPYLYGKCLFTQPTNESIALANEIVAAGRGPLAKLNLPIQSKGSQNYTDYYFAQMSNGTGLKFRESNATEPVHVWGPTQCTEVDSQYFFSGTPWEINTRDLTALTINMAFGTNLTAYDVVYANAMEGVGMLQILEAYNALESTKRKIPYAIVRGSSNWSHKPVNMTSRGVWEYVHNAVTADFGYTYVVGIKGYSNTILSMLAARCMAMDNMHPDQCKFSLDA